MSIPPPDQETPSDDYAAVIRERSWRDFEVEKTAEQIAAEQEIGPITDPRSHVFPDWPDGNSVDDFIARAKGVDREDIAS